MHNTPQGAEGDPDLVGEYARTNMGWSSYPRDGKSTSKSYLHFGSPRRSFCSLFLTAWRFRILPEPILSQTLERAAQTRSDANSLVDSVSFQPSPDPDRPCEDRRYAAQWALPNGLWTCLAVFDGNSPFHYPYTLQ